MCHCKFVSVIITWDYPEFTGAYAEVLGSNCRTFFFLETHNLFDDILLELQKVFNSAH